MILPLIRIAEVLGEPDDRPVERSDGASDDGPLQVIVYNNDDLSVGLVVDSIIDILDQKVALQSRVTRRGILGTAIVQGKVTEIVDSDTIVALAGFAAGREVSLT